MAGADAQTVASTVTTPLERNFGEIPGLTQMTSSSGTEYSEITLQFDRSRTVDSVAQDVQAAINATSGFLPPRLPSPSVYKKTNPANTPVLMPALTSETLPLTKVSYYANSILAQNISQMPRVRLITHRRRAEPGDPGTGQRGATGSGGPRPRSGANGAGHGHG